jgi:uncharacterized damage-inducible protein DinB
VLRLSAFGLTDLEARLTPTPSTLSIGGLIKHVAAVERFWIDVVLARVDIPSTEESFSDYFRLVPGETLGAVLEVYAHAATATEEVLASLPEFGRAVPVPKGVPWFPQDVESWSVRWVLLHLIEETARHAGHADIIREAIDGATAMPLMAAQEGWPESQWVKPWRRALGTN